MRKRDIVFLLARGLGLWLWLHVISFVLRCRLCWLCAGSFNPSRTSEERFPESAGGEGRGAVPFACSTESWEDR
ncbi:hypothetical protein OH76DRAFT_1395905 [Lentinus brumalis]|uniref:Uncharacterized protein n=1 Tax=Lentinus brumalis TaxID=2498619 RepID=A0A371DW42_9APHY|nr:hypothetical protein OH76DRAFT_1395905 [Polyporus brumalis]